VQGESVSAAVRRAFNKVLPTPDNPRTSIRVRQGTKLRLDRHGRKNQSYDELLNMLLDWIEYPDNPATSRQVELLKTFGVEVPPGLTKQCASFAISAAIAARKQPKPLTGVAEQVKK
jgi:hypothetical protein